jgi:hypothetical protein
MLGYSPLVTAPVDYDTQHTALKLDPTAASMRAAPLVFAFTIPACQHTAIECTYLVYISQRVIELDVAHRAYWRLFCAPAWRALQQD